MLFKSGKTYKIITHCGIWIILWILGIGAVGSNSKMSVDHVAIFVFSVLLASSVPVYIQFWLYKRFWEKSNYIRYVIYLILLIVGWGYFAALILEILVNDKTGWVQNCLNYTSFVIVSLGAKFSKDGILRQYNFQESKARQLESELNALKSQINPHFLFNVLNNLYALSLIKSDKTPEMILKLSDLMRYQLENTKRKTIDLNDEIQFLKGYIELELLRIKDKSGISILISDRWDDKQIEPFLLIPIVENVFKYGVSSFGKNQIRIQLSMKKGVLKLQTCNTYSISEKVLSTGTGLMNVKRRLEILYPGKNKLNIVDNNSEFTVLVEIQL